MEAVLYVSHGSRRKEATDEALAFLHAVQQRVAFSLYDICFLELAEPDVRQGIDNLVKQGATKIAVLPVLLLSAGHYYQDIPEEIDKAKTRYPHIEFTYGKPLGVQDRIVDVLGERIKQAGIAVESDTTVLLVGRGSRHPDTKTSIELISRLLAKKLAVPNVDVCYLAALSPRFDEGLQDALKREGNTIVVPYLWFTGVLIQTMQKKIQEAKAAGHEVVLTHYLSDHPNMIQATVDRVHEALEKINAPGHS